MDESSTSVDTNTDSAPVTNAASTAQPPEQTTGSEAESNTSKEEAMVPSHRVREETEARRKAEEEVQQYKQELEQLKASQTQSSTSEEEVDPDVLDLVKKSAAKLGFVSKEDLDGREAQIQVRQDINDLTSTYKDSGIPFDGKKVIDYAKANGMPLGSKKSLDAVYKEMNYDAIVEAQRKAAIADYQESAKGGGEKPGPKGAQPPADKEPGSLKDRIKAAREKANVSIT